MSVIPFTGIVSFSAEHPVNRVRNLISGNSSSGKWSCPSNFAEKSMEVELSLPPCFIEGIDIGNFGSVSVEVQVHRASEPSSKRETLIMNAALMTRIDCVRGVRKESMVFFEKEKMNSSVADRWWDRVRIVCRQPFRTSNFDVFGLSAVVVRGRRLKDEKSFDISVDMSGKMSDIGTGAANLLLKMDKQIPKTSKPPTNPEVSALESSRFFSNKQDSKVTSPLSRAGRLVQQGCSSESTKVNLEMKFRDSTKFAISRNVSKHPETSRKRSLDDDSIDDIPHSKNRNEVSLQDTLLSTNSPKQNRFKFGHSESPRNISTTEDKSPASKPNPKPVSKPVPKLVDSEKRKNSFGDPTEFKNFSKEELNSRGVLVQTRTYKKSKLLPVVGGEKVKAEKGQEVTFYKKGPNIFMEVAEIVYRPEVEPEHVAGIFRDFSDAELSANDAGQTFVQTSDKTSDQRSHETSQEMNCPICSRIFLTENELVRHCATCDGETSLDSSTDEPCPICSKMFTSENLLTHAQMCAESTFD